MLGVSDWLGDVSWLAETVGVLDCDGVNDSDWLGVLDGVVIWDGDSLSVGEGVRLWLGVNDAEGDVDWERVDVPDSVCVAVSEGDAPQLSVCVAEAACEEL